jgi:ribosomal-protein-alanine N-acetyltransferase
MVLRPPSRDDALAIFERYASDPEVTRFLAWPRHQSIQETNAFLDFSTDEWERWPAGPYLIVLRENGQLLGGTGLGFHSSDEAETGYVLSRDAWGFGYATEALAAVIEVAGALGLVRLVARCHAQHQQSQRVLEKCGFTREGVCEIDFPNLVPVRQQAFRYALRVQTD